MSLAPPHAVDVEEAVLCAMTIDKVAAAYAAENLTPGAFYRPGNARTFAAASALFARDGSVDVMSLAEELKSRGDLGAVGGWDYLSGLIDAVPQATAIESHVRILRDKAILRGIIAAAEQSILDARSPGEMDPQEILDRTEARIMAVADRLSRGSASWASDMVVGAMERVERAMNGDLPVGVMSGFPDLDRMTSGMHAGELTILAARPSQGKSSLLLNIASNVAITEQETVALFSLEMGRESLIERLVFGEARVPMGAYKQGNLTREEMARLGHGANHISVASIYIDDQPSSTVLEIKSKARRVKAEKGLGVVMVDYLQLIGGVGGTSGQSREQEVSAISRGLKAMARELDTHVIAASQLSRSPEKRDNKRPVLSDLRDSGGIEQDADVVMFIYRPEYYASGAEKLALKGKTELIVAKHRNGPTGEVHLYFNEEYTRFDSVDRRES